MGDATASPRLRTGQLAAKPAVSKRILGSAVWLIDADAPQAMSGGDYIVAADTQASESRAVSVSCREQPNQPVIASAAKQSPAWRAPAHQAEDCFAAPAMTGCALSDAVIPGRALVFPDGHLVSGRYLRCIDTDAVRRLGQGEIGLFGQRDAADRPRRGPAVDYCTIGGAQSMHRVSAQSSRLLKCSTPMTSEPLAGSFIAMKSAMMPVSTITCGTPFQLPAHQIGP